MYVISIQGNPVPWKSHAGYGKRSYNPRAKEKFYYQTQIKKQYHNRFPMTCPVALSFLFEMPIPKNTSKKKRALMLLGKIKHTTRPDTSNLIKFVEDTLKGIVIKDDSLVYKFNGAEKIWSESPRTELTIIPYEEE